MKSHGAQQGRAVEFEGEGVGGAQGDEDHRGRHSAAPDEEKGDAKADRRQPPACPSVRRNKLLQRDTCQLQPKTALDAAHHGLRHHAIDPLQQPRSRQEQHADADCQAAAIEHVRREFLCDDQRRHRLEWLDRHGHPVTKRRRDLHQPKHRQNAGGIEAGGQNHADDEGQVGAQVPERARPLLPVEAESGLSLGNCDLRWKRSQV